MLIVFDLYGVVERVEHNGTFDVIVHHESVGWDDESIYCADVSVNATEQGAGIVDLRDAGGILPIS
jgi:hypothetical protein